MKKIGRHSLPALPLLGVAPRPPDMKSFWLMLAVGSATSGCHHFSEPLPPLDLPAAPVFAPPPPPGGAVLLGPEGSPGLPGQASPGGPDLAVPTVGPGLPGTETRSNPLFVPVTNHETAWRLIVDAIDDYFRVAREEPVRLSDNILTEGQIDTYPQMAATFPDIFRGTSVGRFNRWQHTLQTIRQRAVARVVPTAGGYNVELIVEKELEDLPRPEHAVSGRATFRNDNSLPSRVTDRMDPSVPSQNWIPLGRDTLLEQRILAAIQSRLDVAPPGVVY